MKAKAKYVQSPYGVGWEGFVIVGSGRTVMEVPCGKMRYNEKDALADAEAEMRFIQSVDNTK